MAQPKLIAVVLLALFGVALAEESGKDLRAISQELKKEMIETLSEEDRADAEKTFSFAKEFISKLEESNKQIAEELLTAWDQVLNHPDSCSELSLGYIDLIDGLSSTHRMNVTSSPIGPTEKYARNCLTPDNIANTIKLRASRIFEINLDFVDDQFIADYWSKNPADKKFAYVEPAALPRAITKAINRGREKKIKIPRTKAQLRAYLNERLYKPCIEYEEALHEVMAQIQLAIKFLEYGYGQLYGMLDKETKRVLFRYGLCKNINFWTTSKLAQFEVPVQSRLTSLAAVGQSVAAWKSRTFD